MGRHQKNDKIGGQISLNAGAMKARALLLVSRKKNTKLLKSLKIIKDVGNLLTEDKKGLLLSNVVIVGSGSCISFIGFEAEKI